MTAKRTNDNYVWDNPICTICCDPVAEVEAVVHLGQDVVHRDCVSDPTAYKRSIEIPTHAAILAWRIDSDATARAWLAMLVAANLAWHMDDSPGSVVCPWINDNAVRLREQQKAMWQYFDGDPHGFMLDALGEGGEKEAS